MMPKHKSRPHGRPKKPPPPPSDTIFFYLPNVLPYGIFCQWHPSHFAIPHESLHWLSSPILSNYATPLFFTCAEQSYMFCKALFFNDNDTCDRILRSTDPKEQKKLGQKVKGFDAIQWTQVKSRVCRVGSWYKYRCNERLREVLLGTGEQELCEASRRDRVWGIGFNAQEADGHREEWGENRLGQALMAVRTRLREKIKAEREGEKVGWDWDGAEEEEHEKAGEDAEELLGGEQCD